jgi:hypothetical protein
MSWDKIQQLRKQLDGGGDGLAVVEPLEALRSSWPQPVVAQLLAEALLRCGHAADALACLNTDINDGIANHWTYYWLASCLMAAGDPQGAAAAFRRCHALQGWQASEACGYTFTHDPCSAHLPLWQGWFEATITQAPIRILELGGHQGCFSLWLLDQVVAPRGGSLTCIDTWQDGSEHTLVAAHGLTLEQLFDANVARSPHAAQLQKCKGPWQELLSGLSAGSFDLIAIHNAHDARAVLESAVHAHRLLAPGGFLLYGDTGPGTSEALDWICTAYAADTTLCARQGQLLLQRQRRSALPQRLLLVLGMHRSGTSALSGLLCHMGFTGPRQPDAPGSDNPTGYWEAPAVRAVHNTVLAGLSCSWDDLMLPPDLIGAHALDDALLQLEQALQSDFPSLTPGEVALIKDPRQCRLQPLWNALLQKYQLQACALLVLRHPMAVALSLQTRDRLSLGRSLLLWLAHTLEAERHSRSLPRCVVAYERLLQDPLATLQCCWALAGLPAQAPSQADLENWIRPDLNHAPIDLPAESADLPGGDPELLKLACSVYERLAVHHGAAIPTDDWPHLDADHAELQRRLNGLAEQSSRLELVQLFWEPAGGGGFSEEHSIRQNTPVGRAPTAIELVLPDAAASPLRLRLDPSEQPGVITLHRLELRDADGVLLWGWELAGRDGAPVSPPCSPISPHAAFLENGELVASDHDPALVLDIPPAVLQHLNGGARLLLEAQWQPLPAPLARHLLHSAKLEASA